MTYDSFLSSLTWQGNTTAYPPISVVLTANSVQFAINDISKVTLAAGKTAPSAGVMYPANAVVYMTVPTEIAPFLMLYAFPTTNDYKEVYLGKLYDSNVSPSASDTSMSSVERYLFSLNWYTGTPRVICRVIYNGDTDCGLVSPSLPINAIPQTVLDTWNAAHSGTDRINYIWEKQSND